LFVKICGITRQEDADLAVDLGASAIGFIFWPGSPRYIAPLDARAMIRRKPAGIKAVGVFVDEPPDKVREMAQIAELDTVQLHGNESAADVHACSPIGIIKAVALNGAPVDLSGFPDDVIILLDAHDPVRRGGTGQTVDWEAARRIATSRRTILSGGLNPENVARAITAVEPYGIDASSGVESAPGIKDPARLKRFFEALNG
jgi:phosphoribosylanthranilate isomerase